MNRIAWSALCTLFIGGCVIHGTEEQAIERFQFDVSSPARLVTRIDDGSLEIVGTQSQEIRMTVVKKARGPNEDAAAALLEHIVVATEQDGNAVRLEIKSGSAWKWDDEGFGPRHLQADVEIRVPQETDLELTTQDGRIVVENIRGRIQAETGDGRVRLRDIAGDIHARSSDGSIIGVELDGPIDVATEDGRIELDGRIQKLSAITSDGSIKIRCDAKMPSPKEDWHVRTSDGSITITFPRDLSAELEASTSDGRIVNELQFTEAEEDKHRIKGKLGEGGNLIYVKTSDGRITLRSR
jgi:DUF4097 and DUF4098 domain-containing protein YvlB